MWLKDFSHVVIPPEPRLAKCDICTSLKLLKSMLTTPASVKPDIDRILSAHRRHVTRERQLYWIRRDMACANPTVFLSFIMDGMAQTCSNLPNYNPRLRKLLPIAEFHIFGIINHVHGRNKFFICHDGIRKDSNLSISCLLWSLADVPQPWPPVLFLQVFIVACIMH